MTRSQSTPADDVPHLLVVDDDARIRSLLLRFLVQQGYRVTVAGDAAEARACMAGVRFDLAVLDVMMPGEDGVSLARGLRAAGHSLPILMLTAKAETADRIAGLEAGVDDYLAKPFEPAELVLRVQAILRRAGDTPAAGGAAIVGRFALDAERGLLTDGDETVRLTEREVEILRVLTARAGDTVPRADLVAEGVAPGDRSVDVQITRLRRKIGDDAAEPRVLLTVRGVGYRLVTA